MSKEIKGDRQRDERIDISSPPFGFLREEENGFKAAALMKEETRRSRVPAESDGRMAERLCVSGV